jgi:hypothetical protein
VDQDEPTIPGAPAAPGADQSSDSSGTDPVAPQWPAPAGPQWPAPAGPQWPAPGQWPAPTGQPVWGPPVYPAPSGPPRMAWPPAPPPVPYAAAWPSAYPPQYPAPGWAAPGPGPGRPAAGYQTWGRQPFGPSSYGLPGPEPTLVWGGIGARLGALVLDAILLVVSLFGLGLAATAISPAGGESASSSTFATALGVAWWLFVLAYHPVLWYLAGGTLGQKVLGLRIARASDGADIDIGRVLVRYLIFFAVTVVFPLGIISGVMASQDPFKRAWHDQVARTIVVKRR